jgi:DNA-binding SARP family transcriptional activator
MECRLALLGGVAVHLASGVVVTPARRKAQALLAYLALRPGRGEPRDKLAALLWGDVPATRARHSLRQALLEIRRALAPSTLVEAGESVALDPARIEVDVAEFECLVADGSPTALARAATLYQGDLLEGLGAQDAGFEEWLLGERERLRELALDALARLLAHQVATGPDAAAIQTAMRLLGLDPAEESVHRALMRLYARADRRGAALRQYQACVDALERELGAEPETETRRLYQDLLREEASGAPRPDSRPERPPEAAFPEETKTPLVGRETERARLLAAWDAAAAGHGRTIVLLGEAGIGKSRLAAEVVAHALAGRALILSGRAWETERILPFGPWVDAVRASHALRGVEQELTAGWRAELARLFPELGEPEPPGPTQSGEQVVRLLEAVLRLFVLLAAGRPTLLVVEDLHWADDMSVRLLGFLSRRIAAARLMVLATARDEELASDALLRRVLGELTDGAHATTLALPPLSGEETERLVRTLGRTGTEPAAVARLVEELWAASAGNPFVIVETMRALAEGDVVTASGAVPVPQRVRSTTARRLERLGAGARHVAGVVAVIGRAAEFALLQRVADLGAADCAEAVETLVARRVLHVVGEHLDFTHDRVREVAYGELSAPRRQVLHERVAEALEAVYAGRHAEVADRLASHFVRAGRGERAVPYLALVADRAAGAYAHGAADAALEDALRHAERLPATERDRWIVDLSLHRGLVLSFLGRFREIRDLLLPLRERVERLAEPSLAGHYFFRLGMTATYLGDQAEAAGHAERALEAAAAREDDFLLGRAHYVAALASYYQGEPQRGVLHGQQAVTFLDRTPVMPWRGMVRLPLALAHLTLGEFDAALATLAEMEEIGAEIEEPRLRAFAAMYTGWVLATRGEQEAGVEACRRALAHAPDPVTRALGALRLGHAWLECGDAVQAASPLAEAAEALGRFRFRALEGICAIHRGEVALLSADATAARGLAGRGMALAREAGFRLGLAWGARVLGQAAQAQHALPEAGQWLQQARAGFEALPAHFEEARTRMALATLAQAAGDGQASVAHLRAAWLGFTALGAPLRARQAETLAGAIGVRLEGPSPGPPG